VKHRSLSRPVLLAFASVVSVGVAAPVFAAMSVYEGFVYTPGVTLVNGLNGGTGWAGPHRAATDQRVRIRAASWQHPSALPSNGGSLAVENQLQTWFASSRDLAEPFELNQDVWISCMYRKEDFPASLLLNFSDGVSPGARFVTSISGPGIGYGNTTTAATGSLFWEADSVVFMVMKLGAESAGKRQSQLWLNPGSGLLGPALLTTMIPAERIIGVYFGATFSTSFDEFRMGPTLQDVFVPAPDAGVTGLFAAVAVVANRRRSR
jgi:hypothetical protein